MTVVVATQAVVYIVQVSIHLFCQSEHKIHTLFPICIHIQISMSASVTTEVAIKTAMTRMEVTHAPAIMATNLTVMDVLVKVGESVKSDSVVILIVLKTQKLGLGLIGILKSIINITNNFCLILCANEVIFLSRSLRMCKCREGCLLPTLARKRTC